MKALFVWQQDIWNTLTQSQFLHCHALLLKGSKGIGKLHFARLLAQSLLCAQPDSQHLACGQCASCHWFEHQTHPNFVMITPEALAEGFNSQLKGTNSSVTGGSMNNADGQPTSEKTSKKRSGQQINIDQIRRLNDFVFLTGHQEGYKIVLIYPAEAMNSAAASALLKKLEEPPEKTLFILVSHHSQHVLPTIRSRCQQVIMPVPRTETAIHWLAQQAQTHTNLGQSHGSEKIQDPKYAHMVLALAGFSPLSALSFLNTIEPYQQFIEVVSTHHRFDPLELARTLQNQDLDVTVDWLQKWCYDLVSFHAAGRVRYHLHWQTQILALCKQVSQPACIAYLQFLNARRLLSHHPVNSRLFLEDIFIQYGRLLTSASSVPDFPVE